MENKRFVNEITNEDVNIGKDQDLRNVRSEKHHELGKIQPRCMAEKGIRNKK